MEKELDKNFIEEKINEYIKHAKWLSQILKEESDKLEEHSPEINSLEFWEKEMQFLAYTINSAAHDLYDVTGDMIEEIDADLAMRKEAINGKEEITAKSAYDRYRFNGDEEEQAEEEEQAAGRQEAREELE